MKWTYIVPRQLLLVGLILFNMILPDLLGFNSMIWLFPFAVWCLATTLIFLKIFPLDPKVSEKSADKNDIGDKK
jgi:hypothetical protein